MGVGGKEPSSAKRAASVASAAASAAALAAAAWAAAACVMAWATAGGDANSATHAHGPAHHHHHHHHDITDFPLKAQHAYTCHDFHEPCHFRHGYSAHQVYPVVMVILCITMTMSIMV